jgi:hypothetical protein
VRRLVAASAALILGTLGVAGVATPASAGSDRMKLTCGDGRMIERTNGSSWWGVDSDAGYVTEHLLITDGDGQVLYARDYGRKAPDADRSTCVADHFETTWTVGLVRTR